MMGRRLRSHLSLTNPLSAGGRLKSKIREQESRVESEKTLRRLQVGDAVLYRDVLGKTWIKGTVQGVSGKVYEIGSANGTVVRKHIDHIFKHQSQSEDGNLSNDKVLGSPDTPQSSSSHPPSSASFVPDAQAALPIAQSTTPRTDMNTAPSVKPASLIAQSTPSVDARPKRTITKPDRLGYSKLGG